MMDFIDDDTLSPETTTSDPIYKRDSAGKIRTWAYEIRGAQWRTIAGLLDGSPVVSGWTTCTARSQETDELQARFEAEAERAKKLARDYRSSLDLVDVPRASTIRPMLAQKYETFPGPCYSQPKLDGVRCIATATGLWTRQGKAITACPHIEDALAPIFARHPEAIFDGELYNHAMKDDFNAIVSLVRKTKSADDDIREAARLVQFHVYDMPSAERFGARVAYLFELLSAIKNRSLLLVDTDGVRDGADLDRLYGEYLEDGYEGQMVRLDGPYEEKRSKLLLKRKEFQDAEYPLLRIEEGAGNWSGYAKRAVLALPDGREFGAGIKGNQEFCRALLHDDNGHTHATVRFFALTPDGVPRFPVAVDFFSGDRG
ncbi:MAG: hypothetical protein EA385_15140 [Salinarimonadaceae bacterium]|nr:MAG: hypothetical protein EA385_15140 [Salinarimonadaceae bacterium]